MSGIRILPLPKVTGIWTYDGSKYPDIVRVPMSDGKVIRYVLDVEQPRPRLFRREEYQGKHAKK
ncbi:MAG: hypothetical protein J6S83_11965 [Lachnospiraceae bacterium]|nr:hypothetical protein [Lachnospiraceae bacterium]